MRSISYFSTTSANIWGANVAEKDQNILNEMQRFEMLGQLRRARSAVLVTVEMDGTLTASYFNLTPVERRGMIEIMGDTAPHFFSDKEDDAKDTS